MDSVIEINIFNDIIRDERMEMHYFCKLKDFKACKKECEKTISDYDQKNAKKSDKK